MPSYGKDMIADNQIDAIGAYLQSLNDLPNQGPVTLLVQEGGPEQYDPLLDGMQFLVTDRVRLQRGSMRGLSGRTIMWDKLMGSTTVSIRGCWELLGCGRADSSIWRVS